MDEVFKWLIAAARSPVVQAAVGAILGWLLDDVLLPEPIAQVLPVVLRGGLGL